MLAFAITNNQLINHIKHNVNISGDVSISKHISGGQNSFCKIGAYRAVRVFFEPSFQPLIIPPHKIHDLQFCMGPTLFCRTKVTEDINKRKFVFLSMSLNRGCQNSIYVVLGEDCFYKLLATLPPFSVELSAL